VIAVTRLRDEDLPSAGQVTGNPPVFVTRWRRLASVLVRTPEQFKAWSQNLGHEGVLTTFSSYGPVSEQRQAELVKALVNRTERPADDLTERVMQAVLRELASSRDADKGFRQSRESKRHLCCGNTSIERHEASQFGLL
jgi:hypothetical protein